MKPAIPAEPSKLRIRRAAERFTVWTRFCCLADFSTFKEAAQYVRKACCFAMKTSDADR